MPLLHVLRSQPPGPACPRRALRTVPRRCVGPGRTIYPNHFPSPTPNAKFDSHLPTSLSLFDYNTRTSNLSPNSNITTTKAMPLVFGPREEVTPEVSGYERAYLILSTNALSKTRQRAYSSPSERLAICATARPPTHLAHRANLPFGKKYIERRQRYSVSLYLI